MADDDGGVDPEDGGSADVFVVESFDEGGADSLALENVVEAFDGFEQGVAGESVADDDVGDVGGQQVFPFDVPNEVIGSGGSFSAMRG